jgi:hypothetical protein
MPKPELHVVYTSLSAENRKVDATMQSPEPSLVIFSRLLSSLFHSIARGQPGQSLKTRVYLYDRLAGLKLPVSTLDAFRAYLLGNRPLHLPGPLEENAMKNIVQLLYEKMCALFGPVYADEYLNTAMSDAERLPQAALFNPRELL